MKVLILALVTGALAVAGNAQNGRCTDIALNWSLSFTYDAGGGAPPPATAIYSDGAGGSNPSYSNGVDGVIAIIHNCSGSNDATLGTSGTTRSIGWNFGAVLATSSTSSCATNTPSWSGTSFYDHSFLNVRNVLFNYNASATYTFTTRMASQLNNRGTTTRNLFHMRMENPTVDAVTAPPSDPTANCPYTDVQVIVTHYPATSTSPETWVAYPDPSSTPAQAGTLLQDQTKGPPLNLGQYTMPFQFTITRK